MAASERPLTLAQLRIALGDHLPAKADGTPNLPTARTLYKWMELRGMPFTQMTARNRRMFYLSKVLAWLKRFNHNEDLVKGKAS
jgi:hypothetical protein